MDLNVHPNNQDCPDYVPVLVVEAAPWNPVIVERPMQHELPNHDVGLGHSASSNGTVDHVVGKA
jgi:hypothetical protein